MLTMSLISNVTFHRTRNTKMQVSYNPPSAKIYQFPVSVRRAVERAHEDAKFSAEAQARVTVVGGSWYHEAAIREAELANKS